MCEILDENSLLKINRPVYNIEKFENEFSSNYKKSSNKKENLAKKLKKSALNLHPKNILGIFTIFNLVSEYKFKEYLIPDIISGLTVGVLHIPTSLAYGAVTSLNLVHGLYSTFFPSLAYCMFATSKHLSVGTFAILSIMVYSTINRLEDKYMDLHDTRHNLTINAKHLNINNLNNTDDDFDNIRRNNVKIMIATSLSFWCGIVKVMKICILLFMFF